MVIPALVVITGVLLIVGRWAWRAMKRSPEPEVQATFAELERSMEELKAALRKRKG